VIRIILLLSSTFGQLESEIRPKDLCRRQRQARTREDDVTTSPTSGDPDGLAAHVGDARRRPQGLAASSRTCVSGTRAMRHGPRSTAQSMSWCSCGSRTAAHTNNFELGQHGRNRTNVWDYAGVNSMRAGTAGVEVLIRSSTSRASLPATSRRRSSLCWQGPPVASRPSTIGRLKIASEWPVLPPPRSGRSGMNLNCSESGLVVQLPPVAKRHRRRRIGQWLSERLGQPFVRLGRTDGFTSIILGEHMAGSCCMSGILLAAIAVQPLRKPAIGWANQRS